MPQWWVYGMMGCLVILGVLPFICWYVTESEYKQRLKEMHDRHTPPTGPYLHVRGKCRHRVTGQVGVIIEHQHQGWDHFNGRSCNPPEMWHVDWGTTTTWTREFAIEPIEDLPEPVVVDDCEIVN